MSRFKLPSGQVIQADTPFEIEQPTTIPERWELVEEEMVLVEPQRTVLDTVQYPSGARLMSPADRAALGIIEIVEQPRPDDRYGYVSEDPATPGAWILTPFSQAQMEETLIAYAKSRRWDIEQGGIEIAGMKVATDERSQRLIMGARIAANSNPAFTTRWSTEQGGVTLPAAQIIAISDAVLNHVNNVFLTYDVIEIAIKAGTMTTFEAIDAAYDA